MLESSCPYPPKSANTTLSAKKKIPRTSLQKQNAKRDICHKNICKQISPTRKKTANNFSWHGCLPFILFLMLSLQIPVEVPRIFPPNRVSWPSHQSCKFQESRCLVGARWWVFWTTRNLKKCAIIRQIGIISNSFFRGEIKKWVLKKTAPSHLAIGFSYKRSI